MSPNFMAKKPYWDKNRRWNMAPILWLIYHIGLVIGYGT